MLAAALISIGVLTLFEPQSLRLATGEIAVGGERIRVAAPVEVSADGSTVICRIGSREVRGAVLTGSGPRVRIDLPARRFSRTYAGRVRITASAGKLIPVITMDLETAVSRVVAAEMPRGAAEAQKAQAIAARSYYRAAGRKHPGAPFEFCDTTHCQLLQQQESRAAAEATAGLVLRFAGKPVRALYFRSCAGQTLRASDVGWDAEGGYGFERMECAACRRDPKRWESRLPRGVLPARPSERMRLDVARRFGWDRLPSNSYRIAEEGDSSAVTVYGAGEGHGVGLCQRGAAAMAATAPGTDAETILRHYYPGTTVSR